MKMTKEEIIDLVENIEQEQLEELMFALTRSGKVVIPQHFYERHLDLHKDGFSKDQMVNLQRNIEDADALQHSIYESVYLMKES